MRYERATQERDRLVFPLKYVAEGEAGGVVAREYGFVFDEMRKCLISCVL